MKSLKVNQIEKERLSNFELNQVRGGGNGMCGCGCAYEGAGGSSTMDNGLANADRGIVKGDKFICIETVVITAKK